MKRLIAIVLALACVLVLVGCNGVKNYYSVKVTGDQDSLISPIKSRYEAGTVVEIKAHPVTDISLRVFVNDKEISMSHFDSDYWGFEFVMPEENVTIHLTYDNFYGKEEYTFEDLCSLEFLTNEITKVSVRVINYSEKYSLIETRYSFKQEDIEIFKAIVGQKLIKADNNVASNAIYGSEYIFYYDSSFCGEMTETLNFNDEFFAWNDFSSWQAFEFEDENYTLPTIKNPDLITYSFIYDHLSSDVKKYGDESFLIRYYQIGSVEFIPYEGDHLDVDPKYYLDSRYGKINLLSQTVFELNGECYEIISGIENWAYNYCRLER